jgi:hypothetical protein
MGNALTQVCEILDQQQADTLVGLDTIKECISLLEQDEQTYSEQIKLLRSQIGVWGSDDTSLFSAQLVASRLKEALIDL